jgi:hypothetical protein
MKTARSKPTRKTNATPDHENEWPELDIVITQSKLQNKILKKITEKLAEHPSVNQPKGTLP